MPAYYRLQGITSNNQGLALSGVEINVMFNPPTGFVSLFAGTLSNTLAVSSASWLAGVVTFTLASITLDVVVGSYISISGITPNGYNNVFEVVAINGLDVSCTLLVDPGSYSSGGSVATNALPNPILSDGNGNWFFYAPVGDYYIVYHDPESRIPDQIFTDQYVLAPGGAGSVVSVGLSLPSIFTITGSPVTGTGTLTATFADQAPNQVLASPPSGAPGPLVVRPLVAADIAGLMGSGTVTSVDASVAAGALFSATFTGGPITLSGILNLAINLANQNANLVLASPASGGAGPITARQIVPADTTFPPMPSKTFVFISPTGATTVIVWRATYACTVSGVYAICVGGTNVTFNASINGTNVIADGTAAAGSGWVSGGAITGPSVVSPGDTIALLITGETGSPTYATAQVNFTRP